MTANALIQSVVNDYSENILRGYVKDVYVLQKNSSGGYDNITPDFYGVTRNSAGLGELIISFHVSSSVTISGFSINGNNYLLSADTAINSGKYFFIVELRCTSVDEEVS